MAAPREKKTGEKKPQKEKPAKAGDPVDDDKKETGDGDEFEED